ncbi:MAG: Rrf2 family transcriptional regulator [Planctomycetota bacterium]
MVPAKVEYATLAILELAARANRDQPVALRELAKAQEIPAQFLVQLLQRLKAAGLVRSTRGAAGGYLLAGRPDNIRLWDIWVAVTGDETTPDTSEPTSPRGVLQTVWQEILGQRRETLQRISIADLLKRCRDSDDPMYYI